MDYFTNETIPVRNVMGVSYLPTGALFVYCGRKRCFERIPVTAREEGWRVSDTAIVISAKGGNIKQVYCSTDCASKGLRSAKDFGEK